MKVRTLAVVVGVAVGILALPASAITLEELAEKVERLSQENAELKKEVQALKAQTSGQVIREDMAAPVPGNNQPVGSDGVIGVHHQYSYAMLDPTTNINRKQTYLLQQKQQGAIPGNAVVLGGAVTAIADYQKSDTQSKFGYLMRHPTASNQRTKTVSEAVIHSAQIQATANLGDWISSYVEFLYYPEQSFGAGTLTDVNRNQVEVRQGYVLLGDFNAAPVFLSLGKMAVPFGLTDTLNPFTASTVWHAFGGLAYGVTGGYSSNNLNVSVMGVQGGAQFRAANVPVDHSSVPSKLNNFAADINYTLAWQDGADLLIGASYIKGSAYCQSYPVTHFSACQEENGAYDMYTQLALGDWTFQGEYAQTEDQWPGTFNPAIPQFAASDVTSWDLGGKYRLNWHGYPVHISADFSRFISGPNGSPWENQDQIVLGMAGFVTPSVKMFGELIRTEGYAPLNFISGGNLPAGQTHSDSDASSNIIMVGTNVVF